MYHHHYCGREFMDLVAHPAFPSVGVACPDSIFDPAVQQCWLADHRGHDTERSHRVCPDWEWKRKRNARLLHRLHFSRERLFIHGPICSVRE
jgi:hypothetical protein